MNGLSKTMLYMLALSLAALCLVGINKNSHKAVAQEVDGAKQDEDYPWPGGKWTISVIPDKDQKGDPFPVVITRTTVSVNKGKDNAFEQVILLNRSSKTVSEVKLRYVIHKIETPDIILYQGPQFATKARKADEKNPLLANRRWIFEIPNGRLAKFIKPVVKDGSLNGQFVIRVRVDEVIFEDGTVWKDQGVLGFNHKTKRP